MIYLASLIALVAGGYQLVSLIASLGHLLRREKPSGFAPPVSILKPVRGRDPHFREAILSHAAQDYPEFEILFGVSDPLDPAVKDIHRLAAEFPQVPIRLIAAASEAPNGKVGVLQRLARAARHPVLLVNDSDIHVPPGYLRRVVAPLEDAGNGLVTCLYRANADGAPGCWEALGIATDFAPSTLVAPLAGVREFGLGSTLVFRAADLERVGGFEAIAGYLADDYQLSKRITSLGLRVVMSQVVVETSLGDRSWAEVWKHQLRWARTIRVSRGDGYAGLPVTHAGLWALLMAAAGWWQLALPLAGLRMVAAHAAGVAVLRSRVAVRWFWLAPLWDVWAFAVWCAGLAGDTVEWRGTLLKLSKDGRIVPT